MWASPMTLMSTLSGRSAPTCVMCAAMQAMASTPPPQAARGRQSCLALGGYVSHQMAGNYSHVCPNIGNDYHSNFSIEASCRKWMYTLDSIHQKACIIKTVHTSNDDFPPSLSFHSPTEFYERPQRAGIP